MQRKRGGFTLVELCFAILIVGLMAWLIAGTFGVVINMARKARTQVALQLIRGAIARRYEGSAEKYRIYRPDGIGDRHYYWLPQLVQRMGAVMMVDQSIPSGDKPALAQRIEDYGAAAQSRIDNAASSMRAKHGLARKEIERMLFPQTWEEADILLAMVGRDAIPTDPDSRWENAEVFYFAMGVTHGTVNGAIPEDVGETLADHTADPDHNGRPCYIDGWGNPIRFYRWPCRLLRPVDFPTDYRPRTVLVPGSNPPEYLPQNIPPIDPGPRLVVSRLCPVMGYTPAIDINDPGDEVINIMVTDAEILAYDTLPSVLEMEQIYHLPHTAYTAFAFSAGEDGEYGWYNPTNKTNAGFWGLGDAGAAHWDNLTTAQ